MVESCVSCPVQSNEQCLLFTAPPGRPAMLEIESVTKNSISVRWEPPTRDGGQPVTGYVLERREAHLGIWHNVMKLGATQTRYCVTHLLESNDYMFRVAAENREGTGDFRQTIKPHKPLETPGKALRIDGIIHYRWTWIWKIGPSYAKSVIYIWRILDMHRTGTKNIVRHMRKSVVQWSVISKFTCIWNKKTVFNNVAEYELSVAIL